jgi:hypothetical protein
MPSPDDTASNQQPDTTDRQPPLPPDLSDTAHCFRAEHPKAVSEAQDQDDDDHLHPLFTEDLLHAMMAALASPEQEPDQCRRRRKAAAVIALRSLDAREPVEAMLATHVVLAHHAAIRCYRRAAQDDLPPAIASRLFGNAANLSRTMTGVLRNLHERQDRPIGLSGCDPFPR